MEIKNNRHACYKLEYHLIVVTKYRKKLINNTLKIDLINETKILFEEKWHCEIININTDQDHIHILFSAPPQICLSHLINNYKTVTSRLIRKKYLTYLKQFYYTNQLFWSDSYYIGSISDTTEDIVKRYINNQGKSKNKCG